MVTERKTPENDEAGTRETNNARKRVRKDRMARITLLLACPTRSVSEAGGLAGTICINAMPGIMLLAGDRAGN
jgi:hypothetical protein